MKTLLKLGLLLLPLTAALSAGAASCSGDCGGRWKNLCGSEVCDRLVVCCDATEFAAAECQKSDDGLTTTKKNTPLGTPQETIDSVCMLTLTQANCQ